MTLISNKLIFFLEALFIFSFTIISWSLIGFQIDVYLISTQAWDIIKYTLILFLSYYSFLGFYHPIDKNIFKIFIAHIFTIFIYLVFVAGLDVDKIIISSITIMYWGLFFYIKNNIFLVKKIIKLNFLLSFLFILLNSVLILHWLNLIELDYIFINRVGGDLHKEALDPLFFGLFGASENDSFENFFINTPRLQGWSSEPLHWSYFIFINIISAVSLLANARNNKQIFILYACITYSICYLYFLHSSTVIISIFAIILYFFFYKFLELISSNKNFKLRSFFIGIIIVPGLLFPFLLSYIPGIELIIQQDNILGEGSNWSNKIGFVALDNLERIFLPYSTSMTGISSHNLILTNYIYAGYILSVPILTLFFIIIKQALLVKNNLLTLCIMIVMVTLTIDSSIIYPTTVLLFLIVLSPIYFNNFNER